MALNTTKGRGEAMELFFNNLNPAQLERLALLSEELGEAQQAIGKIIRHGYENYHPERPDCTNRYELECELAHVLCAVDIMAKNGDINLKDIDDYRNTKTAIVYSYLHHNMRGNL